MGGQYPRRRGDSRELFFWAGNTLMAAAIDGTGPALRLGEVRRLFDVPRRTVGYRGFGTDPYDVAADGQRFLINVLGEEEVAPPITVVTNWTTMLP